MNRSTSSISQGLALTIVTLTMALWGRAAGGQTEVVLHSFGFGTDGYFVTAGLVADSHGNLYGTTQSGGTGSCASGNGCGTAFELSPSSSGWTETILHEFGSATTDGWRPYVGLVMDKSGNLYGTTGDGGTYGDFGTVFELSPGSGGLWTEKILHSFGSGKDGSLPVGALVFDTSGNIYGTTETGGAYGWGTVFELVPKAGGSWSESVLHSFNNNGKDGYYPLGSLVFDSKGNLYGTTWEGGAHSLGTIYEIAPKSTGGWKEQVVFSFNGKNGAVPENGFTVDGLGNFYGTTLYGGNNSGCGGGGCGTVFELTYNGGHWVQTVLHSFAANGTDGFEPVAGVTRDSAGNLYGTTIFGGNGNCNRGQGCGTAYKLSPGSAGTWTETVYPFGTFSDGYFPEAGVILDSAGNIYGTTVHGGAYNGDIDGTVFEITP
jgi:uncharacterized repeat protein (TIGR03803 family)